jgi:hypothetical protein
MGIPVPKTIAKRPVATDRRLVDGLLLIFQHEDGSGRAGAYLITRSTVEQANLGVTSSVFFQVLRNMTMFLRNPARYIGIYGRDAYVRIVSTLGRLHTMCDLLPALIDDDDDEWCRGVPGNVRILDVVSMPPNDVLDLALAHL